MEPERLKWRLFRPIHDPEIVNIGVSPMIDKISGVYGATPVNKINVKKGRGETASAQASDGVEFSGFAKELAKAAQELKKLPDVRENVVEGFRKQIQLAFQQHHRSEFHVLHQAESTCLESGN